MSEIPAGWAWSTIGALAPYIQRGKSPKYANHSELPVVNQKCIRWTRLETQHLKFIHPEQFDAWDAARRIQPGDVLWNSTGTGTVGRAYLVQERDCTPAKVVDSHVTIVRPDPAIEPRYLFGWIRSATVRDKILDMCDGTTNQIELSRTAISETAVPVAPTAEQTRIADQLDTLLARIQACQDRLDAIPALLQRFRRAVLGAATRGELTEAWRVSRPEERAAPELAAYWQQRSLIDKRPLAEPDLRYWSDELPETWAVASVNQFAECLDRFRVPIKKDARKAGLGLYPYYGANGEVGRIDEFLFDDELVLVTEDETFYGRTKPIAYRSSGKCWVNNHAHVLRAPTKEANDYLCFALMFYDVIPWLTGTSGRAKLTQQALNSLPIAVPPAAETAEIVLRVEALLSLANRIQAKCSGATAHAARLGPLTLAKAFRGELVPQDPNDEPASTLLARIAAERSAPATASRTRSPRVGRLHRAAKQSAVHAATSADR